MDVKDEDGNDANGDLKVYLYAHTGPAWYDLVKTGWGSTGAGNGFNLYKGEDTTLKAYVFGKTAGTYEITFEAVDMSIDTEPVIATYTAEVTVGISVSKLAESHYAAGETLSFTISGLEPNEGDVKVGMPILVGGDEHWASSKPVLTNMKEVEETAGEETVTRLYWVGTTDQNGVLTVNGTVGPNLPNGILHITLPDYGYYIDDAIELQDNQGDGVHVGEQPTP